MQGRYLHSSWSSPDGVVLLGGGTSELTTELLAPTGESEQSFPLSYVTV